VPPPIEPGTCNIGATPYQATCERKAIASTVSPTEFDVDVRLFLSISACKGEVGADSGASRPPIPE